MALSAAAIKLTFPHWLTFSQLPSDLRLVAAKLIKLRLRDP
jgi:hypothetical protein